MARTRDFPNLTVRSSYNIFPSQLFKKSDCVRGAAVQPTTIHRLAGN